MRLAHIILFLLLPALCHAQPSIADLAKKADLEKNPLHKYETVFTFQNGLAEAVLYIEGEGTKHGVVDEEGREYVSFAYDNFDLIKAGGGERDNVYRCSLNGYCGLVNSKNNVLLPCEYTSISEVKGNIYKTFKDGKYGYVALNGTQSVTVKIPCVYSNIDSYVVGKPILASLSGKWGLIDSNNKVIVPLEYDRIEDYNDKGLVWVEKDDRYGFYSKDGSLLQPCDIGELYTLSPYGTKCSIAYEACPELSNNYVFIVRGGKTGLMDGQTCKTLLPCSYEHLSPVINGKLFYKSDGKWGIVTQDNKAVQRAVFDKVTVGGNCLSDTYVPTGILRSNMYVGIDTLWGMLREDGTELIPVRYDSLASYSEDMIVAKKNGKYGYLGKDGAEAISFVYFAADGFSEGLAAVKNEKGRYLFVNKAGEMVIKPHEYDKVGKFSNGTCKVYRKDKVWEIDKEGKRVKDSKRDVENSAASGQDSARADDKPKGRHNWDAGSGESTLKGMWNSIKRATRICVH